MCVSVSLSQPISQRYSKESQSSSPVGEPRVYRTGVMGSRDPSQSVGPSNTSPLAVPEAELINDVHKRVVNSDTLLILRSFFSQGFEVLVTNEVELARRGGKVLERPGGGGEVGGQGFSPRGCSPLGDSGEDDFERDNQLAA